MSDRDEIDPEDWLASQFAEEAASPPAAREPVGPASPTPTSPPRPAPGAVDVPEAPPAAGAPFQWGLVPGGEPPTAPQNPPPALPPVAPVAPPAFLPLPLPPVAPPAFPPTVPAPAPLAANAPPDPFATMAMPTVGQELQQIDQAQWLPPPVDSTFDGITEVIEAEIIGLETPEGEGVATTALDSLFGETQFVDYAGEPMISAAVVRVGGGPKPPKGPSAPLPRSQKVLMWVAGSLVAILALAALFLVGTRLSAALAPEPEVSPSPSPTPTLDVQAIGPVAPGEYQWDALLGGECLTPWESAWQDRYIVVDCTTPHPAQMVYRGTFVDDLFAPYPGLEELQKQTAVLCTAPTVINYAIAGQTSDVQIEASFAVDETDWSDGNRTYFCFASRATGGEFTASIAVQQVPVTPTPTPKPKGEPAP